jgi:type I restriction-modification system DNA methylase subunit
MPSNFDEAFAAVQSLAKDFEANKASYLSQSYQESEARNDFINKFFFALGWDVYHDLQKHPFKQEVKLEPGVAMGASERRADYAFYVTPHFRKDNVRFFVEAKKPAGEIATPDNCFQTIRYGANAGTPLAVLTSFRQLVVLDSRYKLNIETATKKVVRHYDYTDYADAAKFREIFDLLSRDAVAANSLETLAESLASKRGKAVQRGTNEISIGDAFLQELDTYRGILARAFKNQNPDLDGETLTEITQRTLDRLVFLRFLEDKGIETKESVANFERRGTPWLDFVAASKRLNGIYNGIVFRPHKLDEPDFQVDEDVFASVCKWLSDPRSFYLFDIIPIHTLGSIYEQFLGKVIVTTDKRARVEEKPEVRKAGGVYYTPEYIVRYIVENTVGKLIEGKTPAQIAEMRFADIACGSGSFLLGVFDLLLHYNRDWFNANPDKAKKAGCMPDDNGAWHLSLKQRREILLNNIYGVDIDRQAVEVAQLSLYLKLLEEETTGTAREYQMEFHETLLPSLKDNIVCGNSLIGTDISTGQLFADDKVRKLNPMNFEDRFPQIFRRKISGGELHDASPGELDYTMPGVPLHGGFSYKKSKKDKPAPSHALPVSAFEGGFDAVIGNPPYIDSEWMTKFLPQERDYCSTKYKAASGNWDIFCVFIERALQMARPDGLVSLIVPNKLGSAGYAHKTREVLAVDNSLLSVRDFSHVRVFPVAVYPIVFLSKKTKPKKSFSVVYERMAESNRKIICAANHDLDYERYFLHPETPWQIFSAISENDISGRMSKNFAKLEMVATVLGAATVSEAYEIANLISDGSSGLKLINSGTIDRFAILWGFKECRYLGKKFLKPVIKASAAVQLPVKRREQAETPKIVIAGMTLRLECALDLEGKILAGKSTSIVFSRIDLRYLVGVLNSRAVNYYYNSVFGGNKLQGGYLRVGPPQLSQIPIPVCDITTQQGKSRHDKMVSMVEQMLAAKPQLASAQSDADKEFYGNKCADLDRRIDALVYELYGLTEEEINIVRGAAA